MNISTATPTLASWKAVAHTSTTVVTDVTYKGRAYGELHVTAREDYAIAFPLIGKPEIFKGANCADRAWRHLVGAPVPIEVVYHLQDQAVSVCPF